MTPKSNNNKKRFFYDLPVEIRHLKDCDEDLEKFILTEELVTKKSSPKYGSYVPVVIAVQYVNDDGHTVRFNLSDLSVEQHRRLLYNMGFTTCAIATKFECREELGHYITYTKDYKARINTYEVDDKNTNPPVTANVHKINNNTCRAVNVVFHERLLRHLLWLQAEKDPTSTDYDAKRVHQNFWQVASVAYNSGTAFSVNHPEITAMLNVNDDEEDDDIRQFGRTTTGDTVDYECFQSKYTAADTFSEIVIPKDDPYLHVLVHDPEVNAKRNIEFHSPKRLQRTMLFLFTARRLIKATMLAYNGGTEDSSMDVYDCIDMVMHTVQGGFTALSVYYFYMRCEEQDEIDDDFFPFLDPMPRKCRRSKSVETPPTEVIDIMNASNQAHENELLALLDFNREHDGYEVTEEENCLDVGKENQILQGKMTAMRYQDRMIREEDQHTDPMKHKQSDIFE
jgi:hypothetical protein